MPRHRYCQNPLPLGPDAPPVELYGPEQPTLPGLQVAEQGQLDVVALGPLFETGNEMALTEGPIKDRKKLGHDPSRLIALTGGRKKMAAETPDVSL